MTDPALLDVLDALTKQVSDLRERQAAHTAALVTLARYLAVRDRVDLVALAKDVETMAEVQPLEGWKAGLQELAETLRQVRVTRR